MLDSEMHEKLEKTNEYLASQNVSSAIASARLAHRILDQIIAFMVPGVLESEVKQYALDCFSRHGIERTWHPPYIRFGDHTLLTFMDKANEDKTLGDTDIAFVDIGIVSGGIEGDAGRTVIFGENAQHKKLCDASYIIYNEAVAYWSKHNPSGTALYQHIYALAEKMDVLWNLDPAGHLIGAFPHRGWKRGINHFPNTVDGGKWILEIQLKHKSLPFGAFFEDLLYHKE